MFIGNGVLVEGAKRDQRGSKERDTYTVHWVEYRAQITKIKTISATFVAGVLGCLSPQAFAILSHLLSSRFDLVNPRIIEII